MDIHINMKIYIYKSSTVTVYDMQIYPFLIPLLLNPFTSFLFSCLLRITSVPFAVLFQFFGSIVCLFVFWLVLLVVLTFITFSSPQKHARF